MDKAYKEYIRDLARHSKNVVFLNSSAQHASMVMSTIFDASKGSVKIFAGNLRGDVSSDSEYQSSLSQFLRKKGRLQILLEEYEKSQPPNIKSLLRYFKISDPACIDIRLLNNYELRLGENNDQRIHFCVADRKMYRLETNTELYLAKGNFNDPATADKLSDIFDQVFFSEKSSPIDILA
jgi:hypothetical protein